MSRRQFSGILLVAIWLLAALFSVGGAGGRLTAGELQFGAAQTVDLREFQAELQPGTLVFHHGACLPVRVCTWSTLTHVGVLLPDAAGNWTVYDSANRAGVRKTGLAEYLAECCPNRLDLCHPAVPLTAVQQRDLRTALESELGKPYQISQYATGGTGEGRHCSEYATRCLMAAQVLEARQPSRVSPASLRAGIEQDQLYRAGNAWTLHVVEIPPPPVEENWYQSAWRQTKDCAWQSRIAVNRSLFCCE